MGIYSAPPVLLGLLALLAETGTAFRLPALPAHRHRHRHRHARWELNMMAAGPDGGGNMKARLREESEAPFQTVRLFLYPAVGGLALTSSAFSVAQIVGGNVCSVDQTPVPCSLNLGVGVFFALGCGWSWLQERANREKRLARVEKGAALAALRVRVQSSVMGGGGGGSDTVAVPLSSFRRDRGQARRVVIVIGTAAALAPSLEAAAAKAQGLADAELLVVPYLIDGPADSEAAWASEAVFAMPGGDRDAWRKLASEEISAAQAQGVAVEGEGAQGILIVLKKNGRVGQRGLTPPAASGEALPWQSLISDVNLRVARGMDVSNI